MSEVHWLPNWKGTRLHAVVGPEPREVVMAACGATAYPINAKDIKRIAKGDVPRCKHCEMFFRKKKKPSAIFLDAESREALAATGTESRVCQDIASRQQRGVSKYGFTVEGNPLPLISWLRHAYEECLDQAVYLRRAIEEIEKSRDAQLSNAPANPRQEGDSK